MPLSKFDLIRVLNPFDPSQHSKEVAEFDASKPMSLRDFFPIMAEEHVVSINGRIIHEEDFKTHYIQAGDTVVVCPVPAGGGGSGSNGGSKSVLRLVAMVVVMVVAWELAPVLAGAMGGAEAVWAGALIMAGGVAVNALIPNKPLSSSFGQQDPGDSPTYGVDGAKNTSLEGIPVPVVYGTYRFAGNIINLYTENYGTYQDLYMLFNAGEGPVAAIYNVEINGQPVSNFQSVEIDARVGYQGQTPMGWFNDTLIPHSYNQKLSTDWKYYSTTGEIDKVRFDFLFPTGLYTVDNYYGRNSAMQVHVVIEYKYQSEGVEAYRPLPIGSVRVGYTAPRMWLTTYVDGIPVGESEVGSLPPGAWMEDLVDGILSGRILIQAWIDNGDYPYWGQAVIGRWARDPIYSDSAGVIFDDKFTQPLRRQIYSPPLAENLYDFRIRRVNQDWAVDEQPGFQIYDDCFLSDVVEIIADDVEYSNTALLGLKIRITDQLSGIPNVTYMVDGKFVRTWGPGYTNWQQAPSRNPAYIALDMLTNTRYGAGVPDSRIDIEAFKEWGIFCANEGLTFDGAFDTVSNIWDSLTYVFRAGHAALLMKGTRYTIAIERASDPVMMFSVANMIEDSFKQTWVPLTDRVNEIDVTFYDKNDSYKPHTVKVVDQVAQSLQPPRNSAITLFGVTDIERAYKEGLMILNMNKYIKQSVEFDAPLEAIACTVGDVILVQHDMPEWGFAGRIEKEFDASTVRLDRPIPFEPPKTYKLLLIHDQVTRYSYPISAMPASNTLYIPGATASMKVRRVQIGSLADVEVTEMFNGGCFIADQGAVIPGWVGQTATLVDTDVIEERDVVYVGGHDVTVSSPFSAAPKLYGQWMYGENGKVKKPFRVRSITGTDFYQRTVAAIEYNESVFNLDGSAVPTPNYSSLDPKVTNVQILGTNEELIKLGAAITTRVTIMWQPTQSSYVKAEVYVSVDGGAYYSIGRHFDRATINADDGALIRFKVQAVDSLGKTASFSGSPEFAHTVIGKTAKPADVTGLSIVELLSGTQLTWNAVGDIDLRGYEIRLGGIMWDDATVLVQNYAGTTYVDKKRVSDPLGYRYRVKAVDVLGNYSVNEAMVLYTVEPPPPVTGFTAQLVQRQIVLNWNAIINMNIVGYEIRLGSTSWDTATPLVTNLNSTNFVEARRVPGDYKYWIAGISNLGEYSGTKTSYTLTIPRIAAPTNVHAEPRVGDILITWDGVNDIDLTGYELRVGVDWDNSELLITGFSGTSFVDGKRGAGSYHYMVRSYGSEGNESLSVGSYTLVLTPPASVTGFDCVQNGDRIEFRWEPNAELDLIGYEIREGNSWSTGIKVVELLGTSYTMPASSIAGDRTFWIKAIVEPGIESDVAMFSTTDIAEPSDRNVLVVIDEHATGFTGTKYNMTVQSGDLQLNPNTSYGEYTFAVDLPQVYRARNSLAVAFDAIIPDTETWDTATYTWTSPQAGRTWTIAGDRGEIGLEFYISRFVGLDPAYLDGWSLNNTTTSENGTVAAVATNVTYAAGRYLNGVRVSPTTTLNWNKTVAQYFNATFWATIDDTNPPSRQVFWKAIKSGGVQWLEVSYNPASGKFELRDNALNTIQVTPPGTYAIGDKIMFGVVQTASTRSLYVGMLNKGTAQGSASLAAIGALAIIQLHP